MADQPDQQQRLELQYRAGQEDLRPITDEDRGCAFFFVLIAILILGVIALLVLRGFTMRGELLHRRILVLGALAMFAGLSIIAVCGRLTRHRWWGNRHWKEFLPKGKGRGD